MSEGSEPGRVRRIASRGPERASDEEAKRPRSIAAIVLGAAAALVVSALAWRLTHWPAPAISVASGLAVYMVVNGRRA